MKTKKANRPSAKPSSKPAAPKPPPRNPKDVITDEQKERARAAAIAGAAPPPKKERAPKKDADIPRTGTCLCGCDQPCTGKSLFLPGHDSKAKAWVMQTFYGNSVARFVLAHRAKQAKAAT